jgi:hypothetical protein
MGASLVAFAGPEEQLPASTGRKRLSQGRTGDQIACALLLARSTRGARSLSAAGDEVDAVRREYDRFVPVLPADAIVLVPRLPEDLDDLPAP